MTRLWTPDRRTLRWALPSLAVVAALVLVVLWVTRSSTTEEVAEVLSVGEDFQVRDANGDPVRLLDDISNHDIKLQTAVTEIGAPVLISSVGMLGGGSISTRPASADIGLGFAASPNAVTLRWSRIENSEEYKIYRDGVLLATSDTPTYVDTTVSAEPRSTDRIDVR